MQYTLMYLPPNLAGESILYLVNRHGRYPAVEHSKFWEKVEIPEQIQEVIDTLIVDDKTKVICISNKKRSVFVCSWEEFNKIQILIVDHRFSIWIMNDDGVAEQWFFVDVEREEAGEK